MFGKKQKESACCRYCKRVTERDGDYICKKRGVVSPGGFCPSYRFDPFAPRETRKRNIDTSVFDPLDFEI